MRRTHDTGASIVISIAVTFGLFACTSSDEQLAVRTSKLECTSGSSCGSPCCDWARAQRDRWNAYVQGLRDHRDEICNATLNPDPSVHDALCAQVDAFLGEQVFFGEDLRWADEQVAACEADPPDCSAGSGSGGY